MKTTQALKAEAYDRICAILRLGSPESNVSNRDRVIEQVRHAAWARDEAQARANHLPGLSAAYDATRSALVEATSALRVIDDSRGPAVTELQRTAVDELRRLIGVCELALGHGPHPLAAHDALKTVATEAAAMLAETNHGGLSFARSASMQNALVLAGVPIPKQCSACPHGPDEEWLFCPRNCRVDHEPVKLVPGQRCPECREVT